MPFWQHQQCQRKSSFSFKTAVFAILGKVGFISWRFRPFFQLHWRRRNDTDFQAKMKAEKKQT